MSGPFQLSESNANTAPEQHSKTWDFRVYTKALPRQVRVVYCCTKPESEAAAAALLQERQLGLDIEWQSDPMSAKIPRSGTGIKENVSVIQLASRSLVAIFHLALHEELGLDVLAPSLRLILESKDITKCGVGIIYTDGRRLRNFLNVTPRGLLELSFCHHRLQHIQTRSGSDSTKLVALSRLTEHYLHQPLDKEGPWRCSDWTRLLSQEQAEYASNDAYASIALFDVMTRDATDIGIVLPPTVHFTQVSISETDGIEWQEDGSESMLQPDDFTQLQISSYPSPDTADFVNRAQTTKQKQSKSSDVALSSIERHPSILQATSTRSRLQHTNAEESEAKRSRSYKESTAVPNTSLRQPTGTVRDGQELPGQLSHEVHRPHIAQPLTKAQTRQLPGPVRSVIDDEGYVSKEKLLNNIPGGVACYFECGRTFKSYASAAIHTAEQKNLTKSGNFERLGLKRGATRQRSEGMKNPSTGRVIPGWCRNALSNATRLSCPFRQTFGTHVVCDSDFSGLYQDPHTTAHSRSYKNDVRSLSRRFVLDHANHQHAGSAPADKAIGLPCRCGQLWGLPEFAALHILTTAYGEPCPGRPATTEEFMRAINRDLANAWRVLPKRVNLLPPRNDISAVFSQGSYPRDDSSKDLAPPGAMETIVTSTLIDILRDVPTEGELIVFPWRISGETDSGVDLPPEHRNALADQFRQISGSTATVVSIDFHCSSIYHPIFAGSREWATSRIGFVESERPGVTSIQSITQTTSTLDRSALVTDMIFSLCSTRKPSERIILAIADSWTACAPLLAFACARHEFQMVIALSDKEITVADYPEPNENHFQYPYIYGKACSNSQQASLSEALVHSDPRYLGFYERRHWFKLDSRTIALVYAGLQHDSLTEGYLRWCIQCQRGKDVLSLGRSDSARNKKQQRATMEALLPGVGVQIHALLTNPSRVYAVDSSVSSSQEPSKVDTLTLMSYDTPEDVFYSATANCSHPEYTGIQQAEPQDDSLVSSGPPPRYHPSPSAPGLTPSQVQKLPVSFRRVIDSDGFIEATELLREVPEGIECYFKCGQRFKSFAQAAIHVADETRLLSKGILPALGFSPGMVYTPGGSMGPPDKTTRLRRGWCPAALAAFGRLKCPFQQSLGLHIQCSAPWSETRTKSTLKGNISRIISSNVLYDHTHHQARLTEATEKPQGLPCRCGQLWPAPQFAAIHLLTSIRGSQCLGRALSVEEFFGQVNRGNGWRLFKEEVGVFLPSEQDEILKTSSKDKAVLTEDTIQDSLQVGAFEEIDTVTQVQRYRNDLDDDPDDGSDSSTTDGDPDESENDGAETTHPKTKRGLDKLASLDELVSSMPPRGPVVVFPYRHSGVSRKTTLRSRDRGQWQVLASHHRQVFGTQSVEVELQFTCASIYSPLYVASREWALTHGVWQGDATSTLARTGKTTGRQGSLTSTTASTIDRSALVTDTIFRIFETRDVQDRVLLAVADSWTACAPLLAWACAQQQFQLDIALTPTQVTIADQLENDQQELSDWQTQRIPLQDLLVSREPRYYGIHKGRHWFRLDSTTLARVYAGLQTDALTEGYLRWCVQCQAGKNARTLAREQSGWSRLPARNRIEGSLANMPDRVRAFLLGHSVNADPPKDSRHVADRAVDATTDELATKTRGADRLYNPVAGSQRAPKKRSAPASIARTAAAKRPKRKT